jgi:hypothetical protein
MTCFFNLIGRFGNLLFIYAHARAYCERNGYELCLPPWVGESIFEIPLANRTPANRCDRVMPEDTHQRQESMLYTRAQVREWFRIKPTVLGLLRPILRNRKEVLLNVRLGNDYIGAGMVVLTLECYTKAARHWGYKPDDWEWETDIYPARLPDFTGDMSASGLNTTWVGLPSFYRLMTAPVLFRANSTFSWWAATLGNGKVFAPIIKGLRGGQFHDCAEFIEGNWPVMADNHPNTDLHL